MCVCACERVRVCIFSEHIIYGKRTLWLYTNTFKYSNFVYLVIILSFVHCPWLHRILLKKWRLLENFIFSPKLWPAFQEEGCGMF